eukprot:c13353_g1_i2.p1 GENE.c13353_g1_i2~~c13353_g1_i2.p1  ORF type:complete len:200 (+),score=77.44 c13353_g1_i2:104-703(+)
MAEGRQPCPYRIIDDIGGAFTIGVVGGSIWHTIKGARNAPKGSRIRGSIEAVKNRAPVLGGNFAVWGTLFSTFDCLFVRIRGKEDPYNAIASGFCTGAALAARGGILAATRSGIFGGVILGLIEGTGILLSKAMTSMYEKNQEIMMAEQQKMVEYERQKKMRELGMQNEISNPITEEPKLPATPFESVMSWFGSKDEQK